MAFLAPMCGNKILMGFLISFKARSALKSPDKQFV